MADRHEIFFERKNRIREFLEKEGKAMSATIAEALGEPKDRVQFALQEMQKDGEVGSEKRPDGGHGHIFFLKKGKDQSNDDDLLKSTQQRTVLEFIERTDPTGVGAAEIAEGTGIPIDNVYSLIYNIKLKKIITMKKREGGGRGNVYILAKGVSKQLSSNHKNEPQPKQLQQPSLALDLSADIPEWRRVFMLYSQLGDALRAASKCSISPRQKKLLTELAGQLADDDE